MLIREGKTNWKYILIVIILAVIVGGVTLYWQWWIGKQEIKQPEKITPEKVLEELSKCEGIQGRGFREICYINVAKRAGDLEICNKIEGGFKYECYKDVAVSQKNHKICDKIPPSEETTYPLERRWFCLKGVAVAKEDSSICDMIGHTQIVDECYTSIIHKTGDTSLCSHFWEKNKIGPPECHIPIQQ